MPQFPDNGMLHLKSPYSVPDTMKRIEEMVQSHDLIVFTKVDHSGEAKKVGLDMRPTQLLIFGSPKSGTPLMVAAPTLAIDLPLKAKVWVSCNNPIYLKGRHKIPDDPMKNISGAGALLEKAIG